MSTAVVERPAVPVCDPAPEVQVEQPAALPGKPQVRISEAMRKGACYHRQALGRVYDPLTSRTCALGAVLVGLLGPQAVEQGYMLWGPASIALVRQHTGVDLAQPLPSAAWKQKAFAALRRHTGMRYCSLDEGIIVLNDDACWSREHIADFLESLGL